MTYRPKKLLNLDANPKTVKGQKRGYMTAVLYLAPADLSGWNVCPESTAGCRAACLNTAGTAGIIKFGETTNTIQIARKAKTVWYFEDRTTFLARLVNEIGRFIAKAKRADLIPAIRLNGTSDIAWERVRVDGRSMMELFPAVQFYDYTKVTKRAMLSADNGPDWPSNYVLTYSATGENDAKAAHVLELGGTVAAVYRDLPRAIAQGENFDTGRAYTVTNADENDLRFLDPAGTVAGLKAKGRAKADTSGFVRA